MTDTTLVEPAYAAGTLADLLPSAVAAVGGSDAAARSGTGDTPMSVAAEPGREPNALALPGARCYVVLLVDGLGWNLLRDAADRAPYLATLLPHGRPLSVGLPSTTATSLTSLGTGRAPGEHGMVGYTCRVPGSDTLLNALQWNGRVDPHTWQPHATVFESSTHRGLTMTTVSRPEFADSGMTVAALRGGAFVGARDADAVVEAVAAAGAAPGPGVVYAYHRDLDRTGHRSGCTSELWRHELAEADALAERLREVLPADVALVVTGDHGMVDVAPDARVDVDAEPDLDAEVALMGGEGRFRHLYIDGGPTAVQAVAQRWRNRLGTDAFVLTRDEAIERGWFGAVEQRVRPRVGDIVVATVGQISIDASRRAPHEAKLIGVHGSLTADEMLVPLLRDGPA